MTGVQTCALPIFTTTVTETGQMYVVVPVPASVMAAIKPTNQPPNWILNADAKPARTQTAAPEAAGAKAAKDRLVRFGTKWLDLEAQALRDDEGNEHPLTASEFGLLKVFAANPKRVLSRERLLELANARDSEAFDRAVDLRIMRIRRKIEPDPTKPAVIRTIRGGGYLFSPAGDKA